MSLLLAVELGLEDLELVSSDSSGDSEPDSSKSDCLMISESSSEERRWWPFRSESSGGFRPEPSSSPGSESTKAASYVSLSRLRLKLVFLPVIPISF